MIFPGVLMKLQKISSTLKAIGIDSDCMIYNPDYELLFQDELSDEQDPKEQATLTSLGAVAVDTGIFTGRSPKDKYIVRDDNTKNTVWWSDSGTGRNDNHPITAEVWNHLKSIVAKQLSGKKLYVVDAFCGANRDSRLSVRFVTEVAWQGRFSLYVLVDEL